MQRKNRDSRQVRLGASVLAVGLVVCLLAGACNQPPSLNAWRDDSISPAAWSTASEEGVLAAGHEPVLRHRDVPPAYAPMARAEVSHWPLWYEDPFEDKGDEDGQFALTWVDYLAMPYSYARSHLNTIGLPVSIVVQPPWTPMVSDGQVGPGPNHDATPGTSADPNATSADFVPAEEGEAPAAPAEPAAPTSHPGT